MVGAGRTTPPRLFSAGRGQSARRAAVEVVLCTRRPRLAGVTLGTASIVGVGRCFMLGSPISPVFTGGIQKRGLGMAVEAWAGGVGLRLCFRFRF